MTLMETKAAVYDAMVQVEIWTAKIKELNVAIQKLSEELVAEVAGKGKD